MEIESLRIADMFRELHQVDRNDIKVELTVRAYDGIKEPDYSSVHPMNWLFTPSIDNVSSSMADLTVN